MKPTELNVETMEKSLDAITTTLGAHGYRSFLLYAITEDGQIVQQSVCPQNSDRYALNAVAHTSAEQFFDGVRVTSVGGCSRVPESGEGDPH